MEQQYPLTPKEVDLLSALESVPLLLVINTTDVSPYSTPKSAHLLLLHSWIHWSLKAQLHPTPTCL